MKCSPNHSSNRVALALVTLGLYIAASLLMQHSIGPRLGGMPVLGFASYTLVLWFTWRKREGFHVRRDCDLGSRVEQGPLNVMAANQLPKADQGTGMV